MLAVLAWGGSLVEFRLNSKFEMEVLDLGIPKLIRTA